MATNDVTVVTIQVPGPAGPPGAFKLGTVTTGAPGSVASASASPDPSNPAIQVVNLTIPRGDVGQTGAQGAQGIQGAQGVQGNTGPANTLAVGTVTTGAFGSTAAASITGVAPSQTLNLTLPTGRGFNPRGAWVTGTIYAVDDLVRYTDGSTYRVSTAHTSSATLLPGNTSYYSLFAQAGQANTLAIGSVTTGASGSSASATITGTAPNQTLNLTIPQGPTGSAAAGLAPGGAAGAIATKNTTTDYDVGWSVPASAATVSAIMQRDSAGRAQVVDPSVAADIATKNYADTQDAATRRIVAQDKGTNYTFTTADEGALIRNNVSSSLTFTVPTNATAALPVGAWIDVSNWNNGFTTTIQAATGVNLAPAGQWLPGGSIAISGRFQTVRLLQVSANTWAVWNLNTTDTGWVNMTINTGFAAQTPSSADAQAGVRIKNGIAYLRGGVLNTGLAATATQYAVAQLPAGFYPPENILTYAGSSNVANGGEVVIGTSGSVAVRTGAAIGNYYKFAGICWPMD